MTDEQLLEEYGKEIHREYYNSHTDKMNVARLIESHRHLRNLNREWNGAYMEAQKEGYEYGYNLGLQRVAENTIQWGDLRKMTIQDLANLIGEEE
jgi:hypothetical protein